MNRTIIVAYNRRGVIGNNNGLPWHISDDLRFFKETTTGHACIMGRNTWDSIPVKYKPLPNRKNIVVTRNPSQVSVENGCVYIATSVEEAFIIANTVCPGKEVFVTGGAQIYKYCLDNRLVDRVLASEIKNYIDVDGAVFFPNMMELGWTGSRLREFEEFTVVEYTK